MPHYGLKPAFWGGIILASSLLILVAMLRVGLASMEHTAAGPKAFRSVPS